MQKLPAMVLVGLSCLALAVVAIYSCGPCCAPQATARLPTSPPPDEPYRSAADSPSVTQRISVADAESEPTGTLLVHVTWNDGTAAAGVHVYLESGANPSLPLARVRSAAARNAHPEPLPPGTVQLSSDRGGRQAAEVVAGERREMRVVLPAGVAVQSVVKDAA